MRNEIKKATAASSSKSAEQHPAIEFFGYLNETAKDIATAAKLLRQLKFAGNPDVVDSCARQLDDIAKKMKKAKRSGLPIKEKMVRVSPFNKHLSEQIEWIGNQMQDLEYAQAFRHVFHQAFKYQHDEMLDMQGRTTVSELLSDLQALSFLARESHALEEIADEFE
jgi:hypothetical protein